MTLVEVMPLAEQLAPLERVALVEHLWESMAGHSVDSDDEARLVDEAYQTYLADPGRGVSWDEFDRQLDAQFGPVE